MDGAILYGHGDTFRVLSVLVLQQVLVLVLVLSSGVLVCLDQKYGTSVPVQYIPGYVLYASKNQLRVQGASTQQSTPGTGMLYVVQVLVPITGIIVFEFCIRLLEQTWLALDKVQGCVHSTHLCCHELGTDGCITDYVLQRTSTCPCIHELSRQNDDPSTQPNQVIS